MRYHSTVNDSGPHRLPVDVSLGPPTANLSSKRACIEGSCSSGLCFPVCAWGWLQWFEGLSRTGAGCSN